ncbi:MAG TPA: DUF1684 domain-containing protein [Candidatus Brachybacterium merdigallinarum]|nr:DUF1684 domain-containing protein [Candidatus Brachybacterium merdigallinarum]
MSDHETFRARRDRELSAPHGILAQVGLHWVDPDAGGQSFDGVPGRWGLTGAALSVSGAGEELEILEGEPGDVHRARFGRDVHIEVIRRGGRTGLRLLDPSAPRRTGFSGVPTYPEDPAFVVTGTWRERPTEVTVGAAVPWLEHHLPSPGIATLEIAGVLVELVLTGESSILFTDETSGSTSADWRVVEAELDGGSIRVDFHRAVNFPAAFSAWATCPRPPSGNHIPVPIRAGERRVERTER